MFILERGFVRLAPEGYEDEAQRELLEEDDEELVSLEGLLTPGSYFGEVALVDKTLRTATILAATPGTVLVLDRDDYEQRCVAKAADSGYVMHNSLMECECGGVCLSRIVRYFPDIAQKVEQSARQLINQHNRNRSSMVCGPGGPVGECLRWLVQLHRLATVLPLSCTRMAGNGQDGDWWRRSRPGEDAGECGAEAELG